LGKYRILIVDDDVDLCEELSDALEQEGYCAEFTPDPAEAERLVAEDGYDMLLLDYKMPGLGGTGVLKTMKSRKAKTRVLVVSGRPFVESLLKEAGVLDAVSVIVPKPIRFEALLEIIRSTKEPPSL
jgi:DNA-binding NtrC family response regulator